jgi:hypothetical protein
MTAEEFDERFAYYEMSGEGDARYLAGVIAATIHNEMERYISAKAGQNIKPERIHNPEHYLPDVMRTRHNKAKTGRIEATDPNAAEKTARQLGIY